jgi:hypothetical protein
MIDNARDLKMNTTKLIRAFAVGLGVLGLAAWSATYADSISVTGTSGTTYPGNNTGQGSANKGREIYSATVANDANNLYITLALNPAGNATTQGGFDYLMAITSGNPSAGGDTSANATTHGNAYDRTISIDSGFGGMTDMIGIYTPNSSSPYSFGFNDWVYTGSANSWTQMNNYATGVTIVNGSGGNPTELTLTAPLSDFTNLNWTAGSTFDFDFDSTGTGAGQTAYGDLALSGPVQGGIYYVNGLASTNSGTYSATYQFNETVLDQYTVVPEPSTLALVGLSGLSLMLIRRRRK